MNQQPEQRRPGSARTYTPMTISLDERTRTRLRSIADAAGASRTAIIVLALEELFGGRRDATIAQMVRRGGARKRRK